MPIQGLIIINLISVKCLEGSRELGLYMSKKKSCFLHNHYGLPRVTVLVIRLGKEKAIKWVGHDFSLTDLTFGFWIIPALLSYAYRFFSFYLFHHRVIISEVFQQVHSHQLPLLWRVDRNCRWEVLGTIYFMPTNNLLEVPGVGILVLFIQKCLTSRGSRLMVISMRSWLAPCFAPLSLLSFVFPIPKTDLQNTI